MDTDAPQWFSLMPDEPPSIPPETVTVTLTPRYGYMPDFPPITAKDIAVAPLSGDWAPLPHTPEQIRAAVTSHLAPFRR